MQCIGKGTELLGAEQGLDKDSVLSVVGKLVLVGIGSDGANVNTGDQKGMKGQLHRALPWVYWGWCYAHRLKTSL